MSIISDICADASNGIKDRWVIKLKFAFEEKNWELIEEIIKEIALFRFAE